jgi:hypothetical protein
MPVPTMHGLNRTVGEYLRPCTCHRPGQSNHVGQGLNRPRARIEQRTVKCFTAGSGMRSFVRQKLHQRPRCAELRVPGLNVAKAGCGMRTMQGPILDRLARDPVHIDQRKNIRRCFGEQIDQAIPNVLPQMRSNFVRRQPKPCINQPDIATRSTMSNFMRL